MDSIPHGASESHSPEPARTPAAPSSLEDIVVLVARGDEEAFEEFFARTSGGVLGLVRRILRDPAQSEEVTQEVMVEAWRTATRFDPRRGSARSWVLTLAHSRAVDRVRQSQASRRREDLAGRQAVVRDYDMVEEEVQTRLEHQAVRKCMRGLTEVQRHSVQLAYYGGYTYREVAELLGVPLGTVKTRLRDGLIRLRDCLGVTA